MLGYFDEVPDHPDLITIRCLVCDREVTRFVKGETFPENFEFNGPDGDQFVQAYEPTLSHYCDVAKEAGL